MVELKDVDGSNKLWMLTDANGTPHNFYFSGAMVCFGASKHTFRVPKRSHKGSGQKKCGDKVVNISFSQESLDYCPLFVVRKPFGFLTANAQQGSSLTLRNPFSCADSAKKQKGVPGW